MIIVVCGISVSMIIICTMRSSTTPNVMRTQNLLDKKSSLFSGSPPPPHTPSHSPLSNESTFCSNRSLSQDRTYPAVGDSTGGCCDGSIKPRTHIAGGDVCGLHSRSATAAEVGSGTTAEVDLLLVRCDGLCFIRCMCQTCTVLFGNSWGRCAVHEFLSNSFILFLIFFCGGISCSCSHVPVCSNNGSTVSRTNRITYC